ncbi:ATP-binding protein [Streptomyces chrestomyceticus]|uniref:ATP-binding protein n=1 Tax=Streptomyces chrestomyceticus TaxID=68185 RepID=UPI0035A8B940
MLSITEVDPDAGQHCPPPRAAYPPASAGEERRHVAHRSERRFNRTATAVGKARAFILAALPVEQIPQRIDDITLCVSELATNALQHGSPAGRLFLVRVITNGTRLRIEVHDPGESRPLPRSPADDDASGRGLLLVDALADDWGVAPRVGLGKAVWAEFELPDPAPEGKTVPC